MEEILKAKNSIENANNIGILTKINASDDAIGATLALFFALKNNGKKVFFPCSVPEKITGLLDNKGKKRLRITFKDDVSEVYYEKRGDGIDIYLTPKNGKADESRFSYKIISGTGSPLEESPTYDLLLTVGIEEFGEVESLCADNLDQLYSCTVINIDTDLNNQNYGEINLIDDAQAISQKVSCLIKEFGTEYMNKNVADFLLYGLTASNKNVKNRKNIPTIRWLFRHGGSLNVLESSDSPQMKLLELALKNINYVEDKNVYVSSLSEKNMLESGATSKDLAFVVEKIKNFFKLPSFLLLWESRTSPLSVKGIFYSDKKSQVQRIIGNFKGVFKGNGALFLTEQTSIDSAKDMVISIL